MSKKLWLPTLFGTAELLRNQPRRARPPKDPNAKTRHSQKQREAYNLRKKRRRIERLARKRNRS